MANFPLGFKRLISDNIACVDLVEGVLLSLECAVMSMSRCSSPPRRSLGFSHGSPYWHEPSHGPDLGVSFKLGPDSGSNRNGVSQARKAGASRVVKPVLHVPTARRSRLGPEKACPLGWSPRSRRAPGPPRSGVGWPMRHADKHPRNTGEEGIMPRRHGGTPAGSTKNPPPKCQMAPCPCRISTLAWLGEGPAE